MVSESAPNGGADLPTVTVIVPAYNDVERLQRCLELLRHQNYPADRYDVVVVDNASTHDLRPALPEGDDRFRLAHERQRGSYAARNTGARLAHGEVFAFTDSDCLPRQDWLRAGVESFSAVPTPDAVGGAISLVFRNGIRPSTGPEHYDAREGLPQEHFIATYPFAATANLFVRAETFRVVGPFDAHLQSGGDREWGMRLAATGRRFVYASDAVVDHPTRPTWSALTTKHRRIGNGMADFEADDPARAVLRNIAVEARGALSFSKEVWTLQSPSQPLQRAAFAAAFCYVRLLRSAIRLRRLVQRPLKARRTVHA